MPQLKKDYKRITMKLDRRICEELDRYCSDIGVSRTEAVERILDRAISRYYFQDSEKRENYNGGLNYD